MYINDTLFGVDLIDVVTELQSQLTLNQIPYIHTIKDTPGNVMIPCPYHKGGQERKPSMGIKKTDGICHCFTCGATVSLQEMISFCFGDPNPLGSTGWNWLVKNFLTIGVESRDVLELDLDRHKSSNSVEYVPESELDSYRYYHPYMWKRKLTPDVVETFDIGYDKHTKCITFPVRDITGGTLFVARRSVVTKYFNYPSGAKKPVYGLYELHKCFTSDFPKEIIICESMLDCLYFWTIGKYAVALNGLGNELQFEQLNQMPCRKFILCTDSDEAGMKARDRIRAKLKNKIITEYLLPDGRKDANDCTIDELKSLQEVF